MGKWQNQNKRRERKARQQQQQQEQEQEENNEEPPTLVPETQSTSSSEISTENTTQTKHKRKIETDDVETDTKTDQSAKKKKKVDPVIVSCRKRFVEQLKSQPTSGSNAPFQFEFQSEEEGLIPNVAVHPEKLEVLQHAMWPLSLEEFKKNFWKRRAFVCRPTQFQNAAARFEPLISELLHDLDIDQLTANSMSDNIHVWLREQQQTNTEDESMEETNTTQNPSKLNSFPVEESSIATAIYKGVKESVSLYFRAPEAASDYLVGSATEELGLSFGGFFPDLKLKGEVETFISRKNNLTDVHFDFQENFTFQLKGSKKWTFYPSDMTHVIRGATPHYSKTQDSVEQQLKVHQLQKPDFDLNEGKTKMNEHGGYSVIVPEGSFLYHPAGVWHRVECLEDSISINISLISTSLGDLVTSALTQRLWTKPEWREGVSFVEPQKLREKLGGLLKDLPEIIRNELRPKDILPMSMFLPRIPIVRITKGGSDHIELDDVPESLSDLNIHLRKNPIAELVPAEMPSVTEILGEENSENEDEEDEEENGADQRQALMEELDGFSCFALHINFGNDNLESQVRVQFLVPNEWISFARWLKRQSNFKIADAEKQRGNKLSQVEMRKLLKLLIHHGFLSVE